MRRTLVISVTALAFAFVPTGVAQAPNVVRLSVNQTAVLPSANVRCFVKDPALLTCSGGSSQVFAVFSRGHVDVFRATEPSGVFKRLYRVRR